MQNFLRFFQKKQYTPFYFKQITPFDKNNPIIDKECEFSEEDIIRHIRKLNPNKAHGHDEIPVRIIKMFDKSISKQLFIIYKNCIKYKYFPKKWKMANVVPVHKKNGKKLVKNYRPIPILPISGKILEKLIFDNLYIRI